MTVLHRGLPPQPLFASEHAGLWRSPGRAGHGVVPAMRCRSRIAWTDLWHGAWLVDHRERLPGTAPIASIGARVPSARSQPAPVTSARPRRWGDAREPPMRRRLRRPAPRDATARGPFPGSWNLPLSLGYANSPAARLMGRRDARPHNQTQKAGAPERLRSGRNQVQRSGTAISGSDRVQRQR
jgi:hypothetical protein